MEPNVEQEWREIVARRVGDVRVKECRGGLRIIEEVPPPQCGGHWVFSYRRRSLAELAERDARADEFALHWTHYWTLMDICFS
jgi:hypothetical protein